MAILWLRDISAGDLDRVGGKAASLGELTMNDLPVPPGFVVTAGTFRRFLEDSGLDTKLASVLDVDPDDDRALAEAAETAQSLISDAKVPLTVREEILASYDELDAEPPVAVRSSATAEDLPDASFAGQQETFLNVTREDLVDRVRECWASLFTERAIHYRNEQGFSHTDVDIAVVVQEMVAADKSGVLFTSNPSTGEPEVVMEAAWGLGEAVVSGAVTPDNYVVDRADGEIVEEAVAEKNVMYTRSEATGETVEQELEGEKRTRRVLSDAEIDALLELAEQIEDHYGGPQDVEWAITTDDTTGEPAASFDGEIFLLQSRPITTIEKPEAAAATADQSGGGTGTAEAPGETAASAEVVGTTDGGSMESETDDGFIVQGLGAGPGIATGHARIIDSLDQLDRVDRGDLIVTEMTTPDMVSAMQRAGGLITDEGGMTCHAAIVARELGCPAVVGTGNATSAIEDGKLVKIDGSTGLVTEAPDDATGGSADAGQEDPSGVERSTDGPVAVGNDPAPPKPMTATQVKVNISIPEAAERAASTGADGVGLLRTEHMILSTNKTPERFIEDHGADAYERELVEGIREVADAFYPRPVCVRTLDAPTDEFRQMEGGENEPHEHNPMLGYRGIRRSLDQPEIFQHELAAFERLYDMGYDNVEIMFPVVIDEEDALAAKAQMERAGISPEKRTWGVMIETPASALCIEELCQTGLDFVSFGTNDLTQHTLALDRNNEQVADRFDELHPAILRLTSQVIETCRANDVDTSICGQAGSKPEMIRHLVTEGITSLSVNVDAVRDSQHEVMRVEQRCLLESVRE